jgi:hypothetical protein
MHTYLPILKQLAEAFQIQAPLKDLEKELIKTAYQQVQAQKTLYIIIAVMVSQARQAY